MRDDRGAARLVGLGLAALSVLFLLWAAGPSLVRCARGLVARRERAARCAANRQIAIEAARRFGLAPELVLAVAEVESAFDDRVVSSRGARGLMQLMPGTARDVAATLGLRQWRIHDARDNALLGSAYLKMLLERYRRDVHFALAAYNAGPARADEWRSRGRGLPGPETVEQFAFEETRRYVADVLDRAAHYALAGVPDTPPAAAPVGAPAGVPPAATQDVSVVRYAHTVAPGESLSLIAARHGVGVAGLLEINGLARDAVLRPGQPLILRCPADAGSPPGAAPEACVFKTERRLDVRIGDRLLKTYRVALGWDPVGDKQAEGDGRTPEGAFYVCQKLSPGRFGLSLGLSYPNREDAERGLRSGLISRDEYESICASIERRGKPLWQTRLGGGVCIHGKGAERDWTSGCIALDDADAGELFALLPMGATVRIFHDRAACYGAGGASSGEVARAATRSDTRPRPAAAP